MSAIFRTRTRNEGMDGSTGLKIADCHCKRMEGYIETKHFDFCNAPTNGKKNRVTNIKFCCGKFNFRKRLTFTIFPSEVDLIDN